MSGRRGLSLARMGRLSPLDLAYLRLLQNSAVFSGSTIQFVDVQDLRTTGNYWLDEMSQQLQQLQKALEALIEQRGKNAEPQSQQ
jgi:hypothetical protein